jgi:HEAT repeats
MRYWLFSSLVIAVIGVAVVASQMPFVSAQGKDKKNPPKDGKDKKDKIDPKDNPGAPEFKAPDEVLGKGFKYWKDKIHSDDPSEREIAMKNILFFGTNKSYEAVPDILEEVKWHKKETGIDLSVRVNGIQTLATIFRYKKDPDPSHIKEAYALFKPALKSQQVVLRLQTMKALPYLGPIARDAFDDVLLLAKDSVSWEIRKEAIPVLIALASPDKGKTHPNQPIALGHCKTRSNPDKENSFLVRQTAIQGIAMLGTNVPPELYRPLDRDPSNAVKLTTLQCFAAMSHQWNAEDKRFAESKLRDYLAKETDVPLTIWTHAVIMTIQQKITPQHIKPILKRVNDKDTSVRLLALQIIGMMGPDAKPLALPEVRDVFRDPEISVGVAAIHTCVAMHAIEVMNDLQKIYDDKKANDALHYAAAEALDAFVEFEKAQQEKDKKAKDKKADDKK